MKEQIIIAAKMYECQETAKKLWKDEYFKKLKWYVDTMQAVMAKENLDELRAVLFISKLPSVKDNGMAIIIFMAAAVEMVENKELIKLIAEPEPVEP